MLNEYFSVLDKSHSLIDQYSETVLSKPSFVLAGSELAGLEPRFAKVLDNLKTALESVYSYSVRFVDSSSKSEHESNSLQPKKNSTTDQQPSSFQNPIFAKPVTAHAQNPDLLQEILQHTSAKDSTVCAAMFGASELLVELERDLQLRQLLVSVFFPADHADAFFDCEMLEHCCSLWKHNIYLAKITKSLNAPS
ncbi:hypothetical protein BB561_001091 [Smittium simulii]|uniref:Uncharacterized protein n=1 Tax=Smittium simulii TaxID=133385 RepID=A0A2T9YWD0_9FUNG|nr:hypothetical protein BB561_001091 [Smittium simulii]